MITPSPALALRPRAGTPRAPGFARAYGRVTVSGYEYGRVIPLAGAAVWAYQPGSVTPWPSPLFTDEAGTTPATFPVHTDDSGALELWAEEPGRVELRCQASGYLVQTVVLDLEPVPVEAAGAGEAYTKEESDARYLQAPLTEAQIPAAFLTVSEGDARYALVGSGVDAYTKAESDARYEPLDSAYTKAEADARYTQGGLTQAAADTRYLQLAAGGTVAGATSFTTRLTVAGGAQPKVTVAASAPSSPATGDLWVW